MMRAFFLGVPTDAASAKVCQLTHAADAGAADRSPKSENPKSKSELLLDFLMISSILCFMKLFTPVTELANTFDFAHPYVYIQLLIQIPV